MFGILIECFGLLRLKSGDCKLGSKEVVQCSWSSKEEPWSHFPLLGSYRGGASSLRHAGTQLINIRNTYTSLDDWKFRSYLLESDYVHGFNLLSPQSLYKL